MPRKYRRTGVTKTLAPKPWEPSVQDLEIYALVIEGTLTQGQIGEKYGVSQPAVSMCCRRIDRWLIPQYMDHIREEKARQTEHLWHIFREAMGGWRESKKSAKTVTTVREPVVTEDEDGTSRVWKVISSRTTTVGQAGDPAHLAQARAALLDIRKIWGVDAPLEVRHSGEIRVGGLSREEAIKARIAQLEEMLQANPN